MHTLQNQMLVHRDALGPILRRRAPRQKHNPVRPHLGHGVNHFLRKQLPPFARVRICLAPADGQASVEQQDAAFCPWREEPALVWRGLVVWVLDLEGFVYVLEGRGRGRGWADREAEAVGLVGAVVGVLACDDDFDGVEGGVAGPIKSISSYMLE